MVACGDVGHEVARVRPSQPHCTLSSGVDHGPVHSLSVPGLSEPSSVLQPLETPGPWFPLQLDGSWMAG